MEGGVGSSTWDWLQSPPPPPPPLESRAVEGHIYMQWLYSLTDLCTVKTPNSSVICLYSLLLLLLRGELHMGLAPQETGQGSVPSGGTI